MKNTNILTKKDDKILKVCVFSDSFLPGIGGTEKAVLGFSESLTALNQQVLVACPKYHLEQTQIDSFPFKVLRAKSIKVTKNDNFAFPSLTPNLKKELDKFSPDIIHCQTISPMASYGIKYAKKHNLPIVFTIHTKFKTAFERSIKSKLIVKMLLKNMVKKLNQADKVFTVSNDMKKELLSYGYKKNVEVIKNGSYFSIPQNLDQLKLIAKNKYNLTDKNPIFLFVGHIVKFKNLQFLLDALKLVKKEIPNFTMLFVGSGLDDEYFKKYTKELNLQDNVIFTGQITDRQLLSSIFSVANLYLFPSIFDNDSLTIIESAVHKVPTLALENTGSSERIQNNVSGFTSPNDINKYSQRIIEIIKDSEKLKQVGENAQKMVPKTWPETASEYLKIYKSLTKGKNNG